MFLWFKYISLVSTKGLGMPKLTCKPSPNNVPFNQSYKKQEHSQSTDLLGQYCPNSQIGLSIMKGCQFDQ